MLPAGGRRQAGPQTRAVRAVTRRGGLKAEQLGCATPLHRLRGAQAGSRGRGRGTRAQAVGAEGARDGGEGWRNAAEAARR